MSNESVFRDSKNACVGLCRGLTVVLVEYKPKEGSIPAVVCPPLPVSRDFSKWVQ